MSSFQMTIDQRSIKIPIKAFLEAVESRPVLWDPSCPQYHNKRQRSNAWVELVMLFNRKEATDEDKIDEISKILQKKWKNLRDNYFKELKRIHSCESSTRKKSLYSHFHALEFLDRIEANAASVPVYVPPIEEPEVVMKFEDEAIVADGGRQDPYESMHRSMEIMQEHLYEMRDPDRMFFLSLVDDFKRVPDQRKLALKAELIRVIHSAQTSDE